MCSQISHNTSKFLASKNLQLKTLPLSLGWWGREGGEWSSHLCLWGLEIRTANSSLKKRKKRQEGRREERGGLSLIS